MPIPNETGPVPDWCNIGLTLRVVVAVNLFFVAAALLQASTVGSLIDSVAATAATVEPVLIASLLIGCFMRRATLGWLPQIQLLLALLLPAGLTYVLQSALRSVFNLTGAEILRHSLAAALLCAVVLYWARLRTLAFSPALTEARLQALQSRIRPHFLFNSLNAVIGLIRTDPKRAETVTEDLAELFRVLMRDSRERVSLGEEVAVCRKYLAIESLRLGSRLAVEWRVDEGALDALVPSLLLQPLIENAVRHGIESAIDGGTVTIGIARESGYVNVEVTNPWRAADKVQQDDLEGAVGPSPRRSAGDSGDHIGLDNVRQRLALVHDLEARIETTVRDGRFVVHIQFPMQLGAA